MSGWIGFWIAIGMITSTEMVIEYLNKKDIGEKQIKRKYKSFNSFLRSKIKLQPMMLVLSIPFVGIIVLITLYVDYLFVRKKQ